MLRRLAEESYLLVIAPDIVGAAAMIEAPALEAGVRVNKSVLNPE